MFEIESNGVIKLSRGDSCSCPIFLNMGTSYAPKRYILDENDRLIFYLVGINQPFEQAIFKKVFTKDSLNENGDVVFKLSPDDTKNVEEGGYRYIIRLEMNDSSGAEINTVRSYTPFYVIGVGD